MTLIISHGILLLPNFLWFCIGREKEYRANRKLIVRIFIYFDYQLTISYSDCSKCHTLHIIKACTKTIATKRITSVDKVFLTLVSYRLLFTLYPQLFTSFMEGVYQWHSPSFLALHSVRERLVIELRVSCDVCFWMEYESWSLPQFHYKIIGSALLTPASLN